MNRAKKSTLIASNAALLTAAMLASFVLPLITDSITEGRANFLRMLAHTFPLFVAIAFSSLLINKAVGEPVD
ncbi:hypothetical protein N9N28_12545 [Rubripirellula amarantea]|uniref:Uncharacterized protein n=1 Tax=Rubripirellula amarantea TaxID=2527999 RepID=A0A5C5WKH5_9BACT|nr:hypothetical protein [Rubripirellula amarantea]MDA8745455.1 hypothetical protein [Rubripirellula amarantea]TWT50463.1 hypothetical protein Pla22_32060 [Rubripirellula amarantea]